MANPIQPNDPLIAHPAPPADFSPRKLLVVRQQIFYRLNAQGFASSLYFDRSGKGRFDGSDQSYGILYVGADVYASWIECYGRTHGVKGVSEVALRQRNLYAIKSHRELIFADLTGSGLVKMGADARLSSGSYPVARQWAQAIHDHPQQVDGIRYRSRHDDDRYCYGIFDRCADTLQEKNLGNILEFDPMLLAEILEHYAFGLL
jgi:RES domain